MTKTKKKTILLCTISMVLSIAACRQAKQDDSVTNQQKIEVEKSEGNMETTPSVNPQNNSDITQPVENTDGEMTAEELLDAFLNGSINAIDSADLTSVFNIADLNMDTQEWDSYSIGERTDLDNDGENELIICGPYGGIYFDARDNKVYEFAAGDGNANSLSYTYFNGSVWIMYSNCTNVGYEAYYMAKYEGADNLIAEISFGEEPIDATNQELGMKYIWNGKEVSYEEYSAYCSKIFAAQVNTH